MAQVQGSYSLEGPNLESSRSGVSWGAIFAGGAAAAGASIILLTLGSGLGFASISPWSGENVSAASLAAGAAIWIVIVQWLASILGGYTAGRLRTKWADRYSDEVFFRDTAHGFLAWVVGTMLVVAVTSWMAMAAATGAASVVGASAGAAAAAADPNAYALDQLFRRAPAGGPAAAGEAPDGAAAGAAPDVAAGTAPDASAGTAPDAATAAAPTATTAVTAPAGGSAADAQSEDARAEGGRLLARTLTDTATEEDRSYLAQMVSERTGLSQADAEARVNEVVTSAKEAADAAREATAYAAILTALSLLIGAFIAAVAGALGGRHRDEITS